MYITLLIFRGPQDYQSLSGTPYKQSLSHCIVLNFFTISPLAKRSPQTPKGWKVLNKQVQAWVADRQVSDMLNEQNKSKVFSSNPAVSDRKPTITLYPDPKKHSPAIEGEHLQRGFKIAQSVSCRDIALPYSACVSVLALWSPVWFQPITYHLVLTHNYVITWSSTACLWHSDVLGYLSFFFN